MTPLPIKGFARRMIAYASERRFERAHERGLKQMKRGNLDDLRAAYDAFDRVMFDPADLPIFNPAGTWMDRIDNGLLMRFWKKKGCWTQP